MTNNDNIMNERMKANASRSPTGRVGVPAGSAYKGWPVTKYAITNTALIVPHTGTEPNRFPSANHPRDLAYTPNAKYPTNRTSRVGSNCKNMLSVN